MQANSRWRGDAALVAGLALVKLGLHFVPNARGGYGWFRDELYYLACSQHPAAGYVDQPPLSILVLAASRAGLGDSLFALRLLPALCGAATVALTALLARRLGGGRWAMGLAGAASLVSIILLAFASFYSMNAFDLLFWAAAAWLLVRIVQTRRGALWLLLGVVLGLGASNKIGVLWLGAGIAAGLVATSERGWLRTRWPWLAAVIALGLLAPYVVWNARHDWAHLEFIRNATGGKYGGLSRLDFGLGQISIHNPVTLPLWLAGLGALVAGRRLRPYRLLAWVWIAPFFILLANGRSKSEYLASAYVPLFAAGGVAFEAWSAAARRRWLRPAYAGLLAAGLVLAPTVLPLLPVETYVRYARALHVEPSTSEAKRLAELPQFYADMFGWEDKARAVAAVYAALPPADRARCGLYAENYGRCGALDFFGRRLGLPPSIGSHNNYWIWGPRGHDGQVMIILGGDLETKQRVFESVVVADTVRSRWCMPYENDLGIYVCRGLRRPLGELWEELRHYD